MKKKITGLFVILFLFVVSATPALAGGMNGAESRVYSAASGTFTLNGKTYRAYGNYLAQVSSYLCSDDVDLTEEQASTAISMMYNSGNILSAVRNGYIYQVGVVESSGEETEEETPAEEKDAQTEEEAVKKNETLESKTEYFEDAEMEKQPFYDAKEYKDSDTYKNNKEIIEKDSGISEELLASVEAGVEAKAKKDEVKFREILEKRAAKPAQTPGNTQTDAEQSGDTSTVLSSEAEDQALILSLAEKTGALRMPLILLSIVLIAVSVALAILLLKNKCFRFQQEQSGHEQRKRIRKTASVILCAQAALQLFLILMGAGIQLSFFRYDRVNKVMAQNGIYHVEYGRMTDEVHTLLKQEKCMENVCDEALAYDDFLFDMKKSMQSALRGSGKTAETGKSVRENVSAALSQVAYISEEDAAEITEKVVLIYQDFVQSSIADCLGTMNARFRDLMMPGMLLSGINVILAAVILLGMQHYTHRGIRNLSVSFGIAAVGMGIVILFLLLGKPLSQIYLQSDVLYVFLYAVLQWCQRVFGILFAVSAVCALALYLTAGQLRRSLRES